jgi:dTDP-4-dehydrorhamnose 3,5-epimerase
VGRPLRRPDPAPGGPELSRLTFTATAVDGAFIVDVERIEDKRGFFARAFCIEQFAAQGLETAIVQSNISHNEKRGTLRGMHYQAAPHEEAKLVRCVRGEVFDVALDLRRGSKTFLRWAAVTLTAEKRNAFYIPKGVAHGFQTLTENTELYYEMFAPYVKEAARGVRWNDAAFGIDWPVAGAPHLSEQDRTWPDFTVSG